jgi:hypothetical protein
MRRSFSLLAAIALLPACGAPDAQDPRNTAVSTLFSQAVDCPSAMIWRTTPKTALNQSVAAWAKGRMGQKVERGECSDLADQALRAAGAKTAYQLGPMGPDADYVWGTPVGTITLGTQSAAALSAGDILQYRNFAESIDLGAAVWSTSAAHHTAVVQGVAADGKHICVYEQNAGGRPYVETGYISLAAMTAGTLRAYRPTF